MFIANRAMSGSNATRTGGRNPELDKEPPISPRIARNLNEITSRVSAASRCSGSKVSTVAVPDLAADAVLVPVEAVENVADPRVLLYM